MNDKLSVHSFGTPEAVLPRLHLAAYRGDVASVKRLMASGDDMHMAVDLPNANGQVVVGVTPLYLAAQQGHHAVCLYLLQQGADATRRCSIPATGEIFGAAEIALIHFHFRTWWCLARNKDGRPGKLGRLGSHIPAHLAEPLLS